MRCSADARETKQGSRDCEGSTGNTYSLQYGWYIYKCVYEYVSLYLYMRLFLSIPIGLYTYIRSMVGIYENVCMCICISLSIYASISFYPYRSLHVYTQHSRIRSLGTKREGLRGPVLGVWLPAPLPTPRALPDHGALWPLAVGVEKDLGGIDV